MTETERKEIGRMKRREAEVRRVQHVRDILATFPKEPNNLEDWIWKQTGQQDFAFYDKEKERWSCTCCGKIYRKLKIPEGKKQIGHNDMITCRCGRLIQAKKRTDEIRRYERIYVIAPGEGFGAVRYYDAELHWKGAERTVGVWEKVRMALWQQDRKPPVGARPISKGRISIFWRFRNWFTGESDFDNRSNPHQIRICPGYLYDAGIEEALKGTGYEAAARVLPFMAKMGGRADYNAVLIGSVNQYTVNLFEYLLKGRFYRLLKETLEEHWWADDGVYRGIVLNPYGRTIEEVFRIPDRQAINRIRDMDGGENAVEWIRAATELGLKLPQETLLWMNREDIDVDDAEAVMETANLSPTQLMNYLIRQKRESYPKKKYVQVLAQYRDYLEMCKTLEKDLDDELTSKPRELKRRHNEAAAEIQRKRALIEAKRDKERAKRQAAEMRRKFPDCEKVLKEMRPKLEYKGEVYRIIVPKSMMEIAMEGAALHHCAGASDRYYDRIQRHESYICFLRANDNPNAPFYTIEVLPGGTIQQHRGMYDEEPEIEKIKPFLREWQQEIRKRMKKEDREREKESLRLREENIRDLKARNNTRVLEGLKQDFMAAVV